MSIDRDRLVAQVQQNCHISDARHGTDFGLCTYLMKMREYYRWETGLPYTQSLDKDQVGDWLTERETLWQDLDEESYQPIELAGEQFDPFEADEINTRLAPSGLMYSAGLIQGGRAQFFLTELEGSERGEDGFLLWVGRQELARGLFAPPAMTRGKTIFLRRNSLKQLLWERYESWLWNRPENALGRAVAHYPFLDDVDLALELMTADEMLVVRAHEVGEYRAGQVVGEDWQDLLKEVLGTPAELMMRALRDHWADCLETLPLLLSWPQGHPSMHTFIGNLGNMRKSMFPVLEDAYQAWRNGDPGQMHELVSGGEGQCRELAQEVLAIGAAGGPELARRLAEHMSARTL